MQISMIGPFGFHPNKTMHSRALQLAKPMVSLGHQVHIFMPPWQTPEEADRRWQEDGVNIRYVPLSGGTVGITRRLVQEATAVNPHIVHCWKPKAYSGLAAWWLWQTARNRAKVVMDTDDWEGAGGWNDKNPYSPLQKRFFAWQEQWGMRHNHLLTVASRALETVALSMGVPQNQVLYVPNGAGFGGHHSVFGAEWQQARSAVRKRLGIDPKRPLLLLYSRLFEFDTSRLVDILAQVQTAVPTLQILNIGSGLFAEDAAALRQQFEAANLIDSVIDTGWVEPADLPDMLASADVGIYLMDDTLLNRTKCPVKLADMISAGLPMVAESVGQVPEYVRNGRSGYLAPSGDINQLSQSLVELLQNKTTHKQFAVSAQEHAKTFAWINRAQQLLHAYAQ